MLHRRARLLVVTFLRTRCTFNRRLRIGVVERVVLAATRWVWVTTEKILRHQMQVIPVMNPTVVDVVSAVRFWRTTPTGIGSVIENIDLA